MLNKLRKHRIDVLILVLLLIVAGLAHGYNIFNYPYYENDEGTYMAQAWSVINEGKLAPYTYWYDHAPLGWFLIAAWTFVSGGFFTFGVSINSGRILMLVLHLLSTALVYYIARRITGRRMPAVLAVGLFSLSPLAIYYQRRVLLDNIMIFWTLLSVTFLLMKLRKLRHYIVSAIAFGIAILTKESAVFFLPALAYMVYAQAHVQHKLIVILKWLAIVAGFVLFYLLFAALKGELFPTGTFLGGNAPHVSLIETISYQASRSGHFFFEPESGFRLNLREYWLKKDTLLIYVGAIATIVGAFLSIKSKQLRYIFLLVASYWFFLLRGGVVIEFYIVPLIPLLGILLASVTTEFAKLFKKPLLQKSVGVILTGTLVFIFALSYIDKTKIYQENETVGQIQALELIKKDVPEDSIILIDNYAYLDLRESAPGNTLIHRGSHYYWKADKDPEINEGLLGGDWQNVDYILSSKQLVLDIYREDLDLVREAYENSQIIQHYQNGDAMTELRIVLKN